MKYNLIVGYQLFEKHLKFPTVRVHVNDRMIDEFVADNEKSSDISTVYSEIMRYQLETRKASAKKNITLTYSTPSKFKVYELDSEIFTDKGSLRFEILDNRSDYSNGFMKKRSMLLLSPVFLVPKSVFDDEKLIDRIIRKAELLKGIPGSILPELTASKGRVTWPGYCNHPEQDEFSDTLYKGGEFNITFKIMKKYGIHFLTNFENTPKGLFWVERFFYAFYQWHIKKKFYINCEGISHHPKNDRAGIPTVELREFDDINSNNEDKRNTNS
jgi:hypothetical protein